MADVMPVMVSDATRRMIRDGKLVRPAPVPMALLVPHEAQARANHSQTLNRLRERGGLDACEIMAILEGRPFPAHATQADELAAIIKLRSIVGEVT